MEPVEFILAGPLGVPRASKLASGIAYALVLVATPVAFRLFEPDPPHVLVQLLLGALWGIPVALIVLALGFVHQDARQRGMNATLWTLFVALLVPGAIGFVVYFLCRKPLQTACPRCGTVIRSAANFCPGCRHVLRPICPACQRPTHAGDSFCSLCGASLQAPARA